MTTLAIAHEWLAGRARSEKTFEVMAQAFPEADLFALSREPDVPLDLGGPLPGASRRTARACQTG